MSLQSQKVAAGAAPASSQRDWAAVGSALAVGLLALGAIFHAEIASAFDVWQNSDAYNHCFLVVPAAAYLAWDRRRAVAAPRPTPWLALLMAPAAAAWFAADRLGVMEGRQLAAMVVLQVLALSLLGWRSWRSLAAPLLYLFFLVPFGEFLVPSLQDLVVHFTTAGLSLIGVPHFADGIVIEIPEGNFLVHQACSGLRFLVASAAFGVLYATAMFRSPIRRTLFAAISLAAAIIGNCLRVLGTILAAHFIGNAQAVEADHVLWGWLFYVLIGVALILCGLPFRQEQHWPTAADIPKGGRGAIGAVTGTLAIAVLLAAMPRLAANSLDEVGGPAGLTAQFQMPTLPGCTIPLPTAAPTMDVDNISAAYRCGGDTLLFTLRRYPSRIGVRQLFLALRAAQMPPGANDVIVQTGDFRAIDDPAAPLWRVTVAGTKDGRFVAAATALWVGGRPAGNGIWARVDQALNTVRQSAVSPVLAVVTVYENDGQDHARSAIGAFLPRTKPVSNLIPGWVTPP